MRKILRITLSFILWLVPVSGIYFGTQYLSEPWSAVLILFSFFALLPISGNLFDAITDDKVLYLNVDKPWKSHLEKELPTNSKKGHS